MRNRKNSSIERWIPVAFITYRCQFIHFLKSSMILWGRSFVGSEAELRAISQIRAMWVVGVFERLRVNEKDRLEVKS